MGRTAGCSSGNGLLRDINDIVDVLTGYPWELSCGSDLGDRLRALQAEHRVVRRDGVVGDVPVHTGERVLIVNGAANRDPRAFADPDRFDVRRANARDHLTFGWGIHRCLGASLAQIEIEVAMRLMLPRLPGIRLAGPPEQQPYDRLRGLQRLPVRWDVTRVS